MPRVWWPGAGAKLEVNKYLELKLPVRASNGFQESI